MNSIKMLEDLVQRYSNYGVEPLSYGTVEDYCDSSEWIEQLAHASGDLKDLQRPWMLKAILGTIRRGGRLLEVGAGEPLVAAILSDMGYEVTVVDPYDGSGNGPTQARYFMSMYPKLDIRVAEFGSALKLEQKYDCVYSISVLEHLSFPAIEDVFKASRQIAAHGAVALHAVDHVLAGRGADHHHAMLDTVCKAAGIAEASLSAVLGEASTDSETYFLSAEGHNRWRAGVPYADFPMRRVISMQFRTNLDS